MSSNVRLKVRTQFMAEVYVPLRRDENVQFLAPTWITAGNTRTPS